MKTGVGLRGVLADPSARRWIVAEVISLFAWGTYLTFIGAYFIERYDVTESYQVRLNSLGYHAARGHQW
jgi:membrane protein DedA with SNARE-associated domain